MFDWRSVEDACERIKVMTLEEVISYLAMRDENFEFTISWDAAHGVFICHVADPRHRELAQARPIKAFGVTPDKMTEHLTALLALDNSGPVKDLSFGPLERHAMRDNIRARERFQQAQHLFKMRFLPCEFCDGSGWFYSDPDFGACSCPAGDAHVS